MASQTAPDFLCLLERSYLLCDIESRGFPIQYASAGFADLYETHPLDCQQKKCGALVGIESIETSDPAVESCVKACGLRPSEVRRALHALRDRAARQVEHMLAEGTGRFVTVNQALTGRLLVVAVVLHVLTHPASGRRYALGFQHDFTDVVSLRELLEKAMDGHDAAADEHTIAFSRRCSDILDRDDFVAHLHRTMQDVCFTSPASLICSLPTSATNARQGMANSSLGNRRGLCPLSTLSISQDPLHAEKSQESMEDPKTCEGVFFRKETLDDGDPVSPIFDCGPFARLVSEGGEDRWRTGRPKRFASLHLESGAISPFVRQASGDLSSRRGLGRLTISSGSSTQMSQDSYLQKLTSDGYIVGSIVARSRHNRSSSVIQAQKGPRYFAVKCVPRGDGEYLSQLLEEEYQLLKSFQHPGIVKVIDLKKADDGSAMIMELIPGRRLCERMSSFSSDECHEILSKILGALEYLHKHHRVAHRDLKAENIIVDMASEEAEVGGRILLKLIDFGSACRDMSPRESVAAERSSSKNSNISRASSFHDNIDNQILPPARLGGRGDIFERDVFAVGLVMVGLLSKREIFTNDVFVGIDLNLSLPHVTPAASDYASALLHSNPSFRPKVDEARALLPEVATWFLQQADSEEDLQSS